MTLVLGLDEAGLGPNLGPLVIGATAWRAAGSASDLFALLRGVATNDPTAASAADGPVVIADSKQLYSPSTGLAALERTALVLLADERGPPRSAGEVWERALGESSARELLGETPWMADADLDEKAELAVARAVVDRVAEAFRTGLTRCGVERVAVRARAIEAAEFNRLVARIDNKAALLSGAALALVAELTRDVVGDGDGEVRLHCDRQGGRTRYAALVQEHFDAPLVQTVVESAERSAYRWRAGGRRFEIDFTVGGERHLPAAAASCVAKYLRERAMREFNRYWAARVPGIAPTAGYPVDARRFRNEIAGAQQAAAVGDERLWRSR